MTVRKDTNPERTDQKGPLRRAEMMQEVQQETSDRMSRIDRDFSVGFEKIAKYNNTVTIFGSARFKENHPYYQKAREIGGMLANLGYTVITGGGNGIMEGGNRGAYEAGGPSVGFNIILPREQVINPYVNDSVALRYFFSRKVLLSFAAQAYIFFPGGFGTLDEFFEIVTLIQTQKIPKAPIICVGDVFWSKLDDFVKDQLLETNYTISPGDEHLYTITEDEGVIQEILEAHKREGIAAVFEGQS